TWRDKLAATSVRIDREFNRPRVGAGLNDEIVFQFSLVAVIHQVHAGIHIGVFHLGVVRHVGAPFLGIIANEVVRLAGYLVQPNYLGVWFRPHKSHPEEGVRGSWFVVRGHEGHGVPSRAGGRKKAGKAADLENKSALPRPAGLAVSSG